MAAKGTRVTAREQYRMWLLYQELGNYKLVGKKLRRSPDTVSKFVKLYEAQLQVANILR